MPESPDVPPRPGAPRRVVTSVGAWSTWFGTTRLIASAVAVVVVCFGAYWLVRAPVPPTEAGLPLATAATATSPGSSVTTAAGPPNPMIGPGSTASGDEIGADVVVHVAGQVQRPGVYTLTAPARVHEAIEAAGGQLSAADLDGLNLALVLSDGQRVYVPGAGEVDPSSVGDGAPTDGATTVQSGPIDLNRAGASELDALPGVGPATAAAIVEERERNGPFATVDDLERVPGIGPAKLAAIRDLVTA